MRRFPWNSCTTFAAIGAAVAYAVLLDVFGFYWQLVPSAMAGLVAAYVVSTALGAFVLKVQLGRYPTHSLIIGVGVALLTLFTGTIAIAITSFATETIRDLVRAPSGQPFWNALAQFAPDNAMDFIVKPMFWGTLEGMLPAAFLGLLYGVLLRVRFDDRSVEVRPARRWVVASLGGTLLIIILLAALVMQVRTGKFRTPLRPADLPMVMRGCGTHTLPKGALGYCRGNPCEQGQCQWEIEQDAFALYVEPPAGSGWSSIGGGLGTDRSPDEIGHRIYWAQREPNGFLIDSSPRRVVRYRLRFDGDVIKVGGQRFRFEPGMLIVIQFSEDWSFTAGVGREALKSTNTTIDYLQSVLDQACASSTTCETAFRIQPGPGQGFETLP